MNKAIEKAPSTFSSVENALRILKSFSMDEPELGGLEIARKLNISKSAAHRLLTTLVSEGFLYKDPQKKLYSLGGSVLSLTNIVHSQLNIIKDATPILNVLTEKTGECSHLAILEEKEVIYLQKIECEHPVRLHTHIGKKNPAFCTSTGQVMIAYLSLQEAERILDDSLSAFTAKTITDRRLLKEKFNQIRNQGYAFANQELEEGVLGISAPIFNEKQEVMAAVTVAGPVRRLKNPMVQHSIIKETMAAGKRISELVAQRKKKK
jgi:DNA-binding IclR family transcriptional regulator